MRHFVKFNGHKKTVATSLLCVALIISARSAPAQQFKVLIDFDGTDGATPVYPGLVQGVDGNLYGTTLGGGLYGSGTVFRVTPAGKLTTLYSFCTQVNCPDGSLPQAGLTLATDGNFYGATSEGGAYGYGTAFRITPRGVLTTLHSFDLSDGAEPFAPPIQASNGMFYGTTNTGGPNNAGTIYRMSSDGVLTMLHALGGADGSLPLGTLVQATDGALYGTTQLGGGSCGSIFKTTTGGIFSTLHGFDCSDGGSPSSGLIQATDGKLYGTTYIGGTNDTCNNGCGTVFKISLGGSLTTVYNFDFAHGANPVSALIQGSDANLYGTTYGGGDGGGWGTIFKLTAGGSLTTLHSFNLADGAQPYGALAQATGGNFYGTTPNGGSHNDGTLFGISTGLGAFVSLVRNPARIGQSFGVLGQKLTGATGVSVNGKSASFLVKSDTLLIATVPAGATSGYVTVTTPSGTFRSNVPLIVK